MAHRLQQFYATAMGGIDSRTNALAQNPGFQRAGENFSFNYKDELGKRNGFQHKILTDGSAAALFEYKYKDINTGESKSQTLGIDSSGNLNRAIQHILVLTKSGGSVDSWSLWYDVDNVPTWRCSFYDSTGLLLGTAAFTTSTDLVALKNAINALSITGLTATVVDKSGATVTSSAALAYTLETTILQEIVTSVENETFFWEIVPTSSPSQVPFPNVVTQASNPDYEGPTSTDLNNAIYITDGGFPMKYDGYAVYRAGMPRITKTNGSATSLMDPDVIGIAINGLTSLARYRYVKQLCYVDANGAEVCGQTEDIFYYENTFAIANQDSLYLPMFKVGNSGPQNQLFPIFSCRVSSDQTLTGAGTKTLTVDAGHNIKVGQAMRMPLWTQVPPASSPPRVLIGGQSWAYYEVTAVTATTITFNKTIANHYLPAFRTSGPNYTPYMISNNPGFATTLTNLNVFKLGLVINAAYIPSIWMGEATDPYHGQFFAPTYFPPDGEYVQGWDPGPLFGAVCRIFRTEGDGETLFKLADLPVLHQETSSILSWLALDCLPDSQTATGFEFGLTNIPLESDTGQPLGRACRYLSTWQQSIVQAGRPYDPDGIIGQNYPMYDAAVTPATQPYWTTGLVYPPWQYSEADLCDFQSVYWNGESAPEGFPQDALHEFLIETSFNDEVRGMAQNKDSFFVFKQRSTGYLTGSLFDANSLSLEILEADVGSACHKSITQVQGAIFFLDPASGYWSVVAGRLPQFVGYGVEDEFKAPRRGLNLRKAIATNFLADDKYICHVPGDEPVFFVYDYASVPTGQRTSWQMWSGVNATSGLIATADDDLLISSGVDAIVWKQKWTGTKYDYSDHESAIAMTYFSSWINFGQPIIDKNFLKVWINSIQGGFSLVVSQFANYLPALLAEIQIDFPVESSDKLAVKQYMNVNVDKLSALSVGLSNAVIYDYVRVQGWELEYAPSFDLDEGRL